MRFDAKAGDKNTTPGDIREKLYHCVAIRLATKTSLTKKKINESAVPISPRCPRVYQLQQASEI